VRAHLALLCALVGCGDDRHVEDVFEAVSGSRLKIEWHLYEDGTRQAESSTFYDIQVHSRCSPQLWADGVIRCVPIADDAVYVDAICENLVGRARLLEKPTHFLGYDTIGAETLPARLYVAGVAVPAVSQIYEMRDDECVGPVFTPSDLTYYALVDEIAGTDLVSIVDGETGAGRLAVRYRSGDDGVSVPLGLLDRDLGTTCSPTPRTGGDVRISNFLLWQLAYTEMWFTETLWPDLDAVTLRQAMDDFASRERRFGLTSAQVSGTRQGTAA